MSDKEQLRQRVREEVRDALTAADQWLLVHFFKRPNGSIGLGADTVFCGFADSRELRGPRWRSLESAREFADNGLSWVVAGPVTVYVLFRQLQEGRVPRGVIMHIEAVKRWAPTLAKPTGVLNSVQGFLDPSSPKNKGLAARRPGSVLRKRLKAEPCKICGSTKDLTLHHLVFREMGGATEKENLLVVCRSCHDDIHAGKRDVSRLVMQVFIERQQRTIKK